MKKFVNSVDTMLAESLDGFAAAHADIVALGPERKFVRRRSPNADKVALISGGGSGHEPLHAGFVGSGHARRGLPGTGFYVADARSDRRSRGRRRRQGRRSLHREELRRRLHEFRDGRGSVRGQVRDRHDQRRRRRREIDLQRRPPRRRRDAGCRKNRRRCGRKRHGSEIVRGARHRGQRENRLNRRGADKLHRAGRRHADLFACRRRDGNGRRHSRRTGPAIA